MNALRNPFTVRPFTVRPLTKPQVIPNSPRSRAYPATRIGASAGLVRIGIGTTTTQHDPGRAGQMSKQWTCLSSCVPLEPGHSGHARATSLTQPVRHARDDPKLTTSGPPDRPGSERLCCVEGRWSLNRRSRGNRVRSRSWSWGGADSAMLRTVAGIAGIADMGALGHGMVCGTTRQVIPA
jgi:hypothetical protein